MAGANAEKRLGVPASRETARFLGWLVAGAFALRLALLLLRKVIEEDGAYYADLAASLARGDFAHGWSTAWPPLYPALVAAAAAPLHLAGGTLDPPAVELIARIVSAAAGALLLIPLFHLAGAFLPDRFARLAAIFAALHPRLLEYSAAALTESVYALLLVASLAWIARRGLGAVAGAFLGAAYLVRPEGLVLAAAIAVASIVAPGGARARRLPAIARFVGAALLVASPYLVFLHDRLGVWSLGEKGAYNFWKTYRREYAELYSPPERLARRVNESPDLAARVEPEMPRVLEFTLRRPGVVAATSLRNLGTILAATLPVTVYAPFALLALVGVARLRRVEPIVAPGLSRPAGPLSGSWIPLGTTIATIALLYAPLSIDRRFMVPAVPLVLILAARGILRVERGAAAVDESSPGGVRPRAAAWLARAFCVVSLVYAGVHALPSDPPLEHREVGLWLARRFGPPSEGGAGDAASASERPVVVARKPWVAYYAGASIRPLPDVPPERLVETIRGAAGYYVVADERAAASDRPALKGLLRPAEAPGGWAAVKIVEHPRRIVLYRVGR